MESQSKHGQGLGKKFHPKKKMAGKKAIGKKSVPKKYVAKKTITKKTATQQAVRLNDYSIRWDLELSMPLTPTLSQDSVPSMVEIRSSPGRGQGMFALQDILPGSVLLFEKPLVIVSHDIAEVEEGEIIEHPDPLDTLVNQLPPDKVQAYLGLWGFKRDDEESANRAVLYSNGFGVQKDTATGIFEVASKINHSCVPNSGWGWKDACGGRMMIWNRIYLLKGEEVTVDYGHSKKVLKRNYGFDCTCGGCREFSSDSESESESEDSEESD